jgi:hypothetical protein
MSIEKEYGEFYLTCDNCGNDAGKVFDSFERAVEAKKGLGWKSKKINGQWEDWCEECCKGED